MAAATMPVALLGRWGRSRDELGNGDVTAEISDAPPRPSPLPPARAKPGTEHVDEGNHFPRQVPRRGVQRVERPLP